MSLMITADDLSSGMFVAIHSVRTARRIRVRPAYDAEAAFELDEPTPVPAPIGVPLKVMGISLPFIACAVLRPGGGLDGPVILDLRCVQLSRLTAEFVTALEQFTSSDEKAEPSTEGAPSRRGQHEQK